MKIKVGEWFLAFVIAIAAVLLIGLSACKVKTKVVDKDKRGMLAKSVSNPSGMVIILPLVKGYITGSAIKKQSAFTPSL